MAFRNTRLNLNEAAISRRSFLGFSGMLALFGVGQPSFSSAPPIRKASTARTRSIHSGHSLTDSYIHNGQWPGTLRAMGKSIGMRQTYQNIVKSTIPGSPMRWRWDNPVPDLRPNSPSADARRDIEDFDTLVITESGPPARLNNAANEQQMTDSLDFLCRFAANTIENGNGGEGATDIVLWSIWPSLTMWRPERPSHTASWEEFPDFRAALPEYGRSFRFMADYASWKMSEIYATLPSDWRVWLFPGHIWMERVWDDIQISSLPGITDIQQLFDDDIHPNEIGGYGLGCLMLTCLFQVDLRSQRRLYAPTGISADLQDYFASIAWDIATSYAPVGMGGTVDRAPLWDSTSMDDPLPVWSPDGKIR